MVPKSSNRIPKPTCTSQHPSSSFFEKQSPFLKVEIDKSISRTERGSFRLQEGSFQKLKPEFQVSLTSLSYIFGLFSEEECQRLANIPEKPLTRLPPLRYSRSHYCKRASMRQTTLADFIVKSKAETTNGLKRELSPSSKRQRSENQSGVEHFSRSFSTSQR